MDISNIRYRDRLEFKFLSVFLSLILLVSIALFGTYEGILLQRAYQELEGKNNQIAEHYTEIADEWLWNLDRDQIHKSIDLEMEDPVVSGIRVYDEDGEIFAEAGVLNDRDDLMLRQKDIYFQTDASNEYIGKVVVAVTDLPLKDEAKERLLRDGFLLLLIGGTIFVGASFVNRRIVTAPLYKMIREIEKTEADRLPENIEWKSNDEIGVVINAFNNMMERRMKAVAAKEQMARELQQAQKLEAVGQLAGGIAHEINTPSQYIGDNLRFLMDSEKDLTRVLKQALHLKTAVRNKRMSDLLFGNWMILSKRWISIF